MLTYQDCAALSGLADDEIDALAEHERCPEIIALEMGNYLLRSPDGVARISACIRDDIAQARAVGDVAHSAKLKLVLRHFLETHRPHAAHGSAA
ncbi:MAG TPA: hypothetical protein VMB81_07340 [Candidatus Sulfotelmatobacter sp.]|nr:hypothetical protein [Candidatus Sulfotelmatobacter sp.]